MLRAILLGMLLVAGAAACDKSARDGVAAQAHTAAGKVVEVTGKVVATRPGSAPRELAVGGEVFRDDTVDTVNGAIVVELFHNNARWSVDGKTARVDESMAWKLAKQDVAKPVDHATSSAGRDGERQGAGTTASANVPDKTLDQGKGETAAKDTIPEKTAHRDHTPKQGTAKTEKPPENTHDDRGMPDIQAGAGGGAKASSDPITPKPDPIPPQHPSIDVKLELTAALERKRVELKACVPKAGATVSVKVASGVITVAVTGVADAKAKACLEKVARSITPAADAESTIVIK